MFDWVYFFERHGIEYVTKRHDLRKNNIGVACPFCGNDPSFHMGVSLEGKGWSCWRNQRLHSGRSPQRLIVALIRCSYEEANRIVQADDVGIALREDSFADDMKRILGAPVKETKPRAAAKLEFLPEFRPIDDTPTCRRLILPYLENRGYSKNAALDLAERHGLMYAASGVFSHRIIVPVVINGALSNWTGRTVAKSDTLRYRSLSNDPQRASAQSLPVAPRNIKECILDYDRVMQGGDTLVVAEGPFDALRLSHFGQDCDVTATCLFSTSILPAQVSMLAEAAPLYQKRYVIFDMGAQYIPFSDTKGAEHKHREHMGMSIPEWMGFEALILPEQFKDPAELDRESFRRLLDV